MTPRTFGDGSGDGEVAGLRECEGLEEALGDAADPPPGAKAALPPPKAFDKTATPPATSATMSTIRAVPRFTSQSYPLRPAGAERPRDAQPAAMACLQPDAQRVRGPPAPARLAQPPEPSHEHRIVRQGLRIIQQAVQ